MHESPAGGLGVQVAADLYGCDPTVLNDVPALERLLQAAADASNATVVDKLTHTFTPVGATIALVLAESHLILHTWPERDFVALDAFTCSDAMKPEAAVEVVRAGLGAQRVESSVVARGVAFART
ncbi:MAG: adenosylmethionine decarboxylase [Austwickia sp.]|nr:MAG: adenosylmethionine decarboxylase [Austwickia sp.]